LAVIELTSIFDDSLAELTALISRSAGVRQGTSSSPRAAPSPLPISRRSRRCRPRRWPRGMPGVRQNSSRPRSSLSWPTCATDPSRAGVHGRTGRSSLCAATDAAHSSATVAGPRSRMASPSARNT
jgi:hypothetical protein